jgi:hypothetical protein
MSSINPNNIDGTYPIAGQDNDSQGFRDNFTNIKNNFTFAASEVSDLQNNAILKAPLSGTTLNNNLNNAQLIGAQISKFTQTRNDLGTQSGTITVNWSDAHFQTLAITANTTVTLSSWPTSGFWTSMVLDVTPTAENLYLGLAGTGLTNLINATNIQGFTLGNLVAFPSGNVTYRFEFSTYDGGATVSVRDLLRNYNVETVGNTATYNTLTVNGNILSTGLSVFGNARLGLVNTSGGQFHTVVGNITQTSSGGAAAVYINTTGNVLAASVTTGALINNGNIIIADPIGAGSFGSNLTVKGTIQSKYWNYTNVVSSSDTISLMPGGDSLKLVQINANLDIGYNNPMVAGSKVEYTVQNINSGNVWVNLPNKNTNLGKGNVFVLGNSYTRFVFTAFGSNAAMVTVSTDGRA